MKAIITETYTGSLILSDAADPEFSRFSSLAEIRKCENVLLEKPEKGCPLIPAIVNDEFVELMRSTFKHPYGGMETVFEVIK